MAATYEVMRQRFVEAQAKLDQVRRLADTGFTLEGGTVRLVTAPDILRIIDGDT